MLIAAWGGYYFTSKSNEETLNYQSKLIKAYEREMKDLQSKIRVAPAKKKRRRN